MAVTSTPPSEYPFQVWVVGGVVHSGYTEKAAAQSVVDTANAKAAEMGLQARYEVREKA